MTWHIPCFFILLIASLAACLFLGVLLDTTSEALSIQNGSGLCFNPKGTHAERLICVRLNGVNMLQGAGDVDQVTNYSIQEVIYSSTHATSQQWEILLLNRNCGEVANQYQVRSSPLKGAKAELHAVSTAKGPCSAPRILIGGETWEAMRMCTFIICILPPFLLLAIYLYCHWIRDRGSYGREEYEDLC